MNIDEINVEDLIEEFYLDETVTAHKMAKRLKIPTKKLNQILIDAGMTRSELRQRSLEDRFRHIATDLGFDSDNDISRCEICEMFLIEDQKKMPNEWNWAINGRYGDICNSCLKESKAEVKTRFSLLHGMGCIICRKEYSMYTYPEIHHTRYGRGMGQRKKHAMTIPLCPTHHRLGGIGIAFHAGPETWVHEHGTEEKLLKETNIAIVQIRGIT
jgi:hypothetical protein